MNEEMELPTGWVSMELGAITDIIGGSTPSRNESKYFGGDIVWLTPTEIPKDTVAVLTDSREKLTEKGFQSSSVRWIPQNSVLLTSRASIGYAAIAGVKLTTNQGFASFVLPDTLEPKYLAWWFKSQKQQLEELAGGTTFKEISKTTLRTLQLPFPHLSEQRRIVAAIEELFTRLDAGVTALRQVQTALKRYRAAVLKAAVEGRLTTDWRAAHPDAEPASALLGRILAERRDRWEAEQRTKGKDPTKTRYDEPAAPDTTTVPTLPEGWAWTTIEQITSSTRPVCYGILMPKENVPDGVLYVRVKDMKGDKIDLQALHRTTKEIAEGYARASLKPNDVLLAIRGTFGRVAVVPPELYGGNITQDSARLDVNERLSHEYIANYLRSDDAQSYFKRVARGVGVRGVNIADVKTTPVALPPLAEQEQIVAEVERRLSVVSEMEATVAATLKRAERLRQGILERAFSGRLVAQEPGDEPAAVLLARIRAGRKEKKAGDIEMMQDRLWRS